MCTAVKCRLPVVFVGRQCITGKKDPSKDVKFAMLSLVLSLLLTSVLDGS